MHLVGRCQTESQTLIISNKFDVEAMSPIRKFLESSLGSDLLRSRVMRYTFFFIYVCLNRSTWYRLHNALERKVKVEKNNVYQKEAYMSEFSASIKGLHQSVLDECENHKEKSQGYLTWLESEMAKKQESISRQRRFFDDMCARRKQIISEIIDAEKVKNEDDKNMLPMLLHNYKLQYPLFFF